MSERKTFLKLCDSIYPVRIDGENQEILLGGIWLDPFQFTEALAKLERFDELAEAAKPYQVTVNGLN